MESFGNISLESMQQESLIRNLHETFQKRKAIYQPSVESFIDQPGYDNHKIKAELDRVGVLEKKWQTESSPSIEQNKQLADVFEGIMVEQLSGTWLGGKGQAYYSSKADDYLRHVDCVVEFNPEEGKQDHHYLGLGIDVTFAEDYTKVLSKLDSIWDTDIRHGNQTEVQYVETDAYTGKLPMHRVVLLGDKKTVLELARLYRDKKNTALNTHPYLVSMIGQVKAQLESYYRYTQNQDLGGKALTNIAETLRTFYKVYEMHEDFYRKNVEHLDTDPQYKMIREYCEEKIGNSIR